MDLPEYARQLIAKLPSAEQNRPVAWRTEQNTVICLRCAATVKVPDYSQMALEPVLAAELVELCLNGEDECPECERCCLRVAEWQLGEEQASGVEPDLRGNWAQDVVNGKSYDEQTEE